MTRYMASPQQFQWHPFDLGWHGNLLAACGDDVLGVGWLPHRAAAPGDGLAFPTAWHDGAGGGGQLL